MEWTKQAVTERMAEISSKGFIAIPEEMFRKDDGVIGQVLEREFEVQENNLQIADLGTYELKAMRIKKGRSNKLTLFHKKPTSGMSPNDIFKRLSYEKQSQRDGSLKRKLFTTVKGNKQNNLGLTLKSTNESEIQLYDHDDYLCTWDLSSGEGKIKQILLAMAETDGATNSKGEKFHFISAFILSNPKNIYEAIQDGAVVLEFCIDQPAADYPKKSPMTEARI